MKRILNTYEYNRLLKYGLGDIDIQNYKEMPVEYMVGFAEFYGREFKVDKNVLIPRIESEEIINFVLDKSDLYKNKRIRVADIATGSGCIGITLFLELRQKDIEVELILSDISYEALKIAKENINRLVNGKDIKIIQSDLLNDFEKDKFDIIVSNLPYIPSSRITKLDNSVKDFEPKLALDGGEDGMLIIKKLLYQIKEKKLLKKDGVIILEIDESHSIGNFNEFQKDFEVEILKDQFHKNRFALLKLD